MESKQEDEIASIKFTFQEQVKVIQDVGEFQNVVNFKPRDLDLQCKFQLLGDYPESLPTIVIRSQLMSDEQKDSMLSTMQEMANANLGTCMLNDLINECMDFVKKNEIDLSLPAVKSKSKTSSYRPKDKKQRAPKSEKEETSKGKKPPMKTAAEVIKRLQWDEAVNKEDFSVGYMDRLTGLEEKAFTDFTWEDLASVDQYCLAIPQHRIQYFKYRDEKVWDKNERLDYVFGSTGSKLTLPDTIRRYHESRAERDGEDNDTIVDSAVETGQTVRFN